jgi:4,5-DOPA dioxygenase extradiol
MRAETLVCAMSVISRIPSLFIAHGGGPFPVLGDPGHAGLVSALKRLPTELNIEKPKAILVVSAHWEVRIFKMNAGAGMTN